MRHATALLYHVCAVASLNIRFASYGTSGKLTLWTRNVVQTYRGSQCTTFHVAGWACSFFTSSCLELHIWPDAISGWIRHRNSVTFCGNLEKCATETLAMTRRALAEGNMSCTRNGKGRWAEKSRACSSFSLTWRGLFTKNSSWQAKQSSPHTTVKFYGNCEKMCEDFAPNFRDKRTVCCITTTNRLALPSLADSEHRVQFIKFPPWSRPVVFNLFCSHTPRSDVISLQLCTPRVVGL
jgi:hypothetical protein